MVKNANPGVLDVYIAPVGNGPVTKVEPPARQARIQASANEEQRRQRYFVWKLLEYAMENSLGLPLAEQDVSADEEGKWYCSACFFSLSHSRDAVAVAISDRPVGVDIECLDRPYAPGLARKILTENERLAYDGLPAEVRHMYLLEKWCAKESIYKKDGGSFNPCRMETEGIAATGTVRTADREYAYGVAADCPEGLRVFSDINL